MFKFVKYSEKILKIKCSEFIVNLKNTNKQPEQKPKNHEPVKKLKKNKKPERTGKADKKPEKI
jgi:hypothetical protein